MAWTFEVEISACATGCYLLLWRSVWFRLHYWPSLLHYWPLVDPLSLLHLTKQDWLPPRLLGRHVLQGPILIALYCILPSFSTFSLNWGLQSWLQYFRCSPNISEYWGTVTSLTLLTAFLTKPSMQFPYLWQGHTVGSGSTQLPP